MQRLSSEDFDKPCKELSIYLLGKVLVRKLGDGTILRGRIVETECYLGGEDKASHSYNNKRTSRNEAMFMKAGTSYVYSVYYNQHCFNISSNEEGAAVLLRALEPFEGFEAMYRFRASKCKSKIRTEKLCNGPAKLCLAMNITKEKINKVDLGDVTNDSIWVEDGKNYFSIINTSRIGIGKSAEEWRIAPLRYYIRGNKSVSKPDKKAEEQHEGTGTGDNITFH